MNKCLLCHDAPCNNACTKLKPGDLLKSDRLGNSAYAISGFKDTLPCKTCDAPCEKSCVANISIKDELISIYDTYKTSEIIPMDKDIDLSCEIFGIKLENPFLLSSSVVASSYEMCDRAFEMGWAGAAFKTISLMDINEASPRFSALKDSENRFAGFKNIEQLSDHSLEENMNIFRKLKEKHPTKVIIASIMGRNEEEWEYLARTVTKAGADVIELNFSCPNMEEKGVGVDIGQDPELCRRFCAAASRGTKAPILAKMTPNITDMTVPARASIEGGADGIAAINTIKSITGVNLDTTVAAPSVRAKTSIGGYSGRAVKPIALRFISELKLDKALKNVHVSAMGGIYGWRDACEFIMLGAGSLQITTAVMEYGYRIIDDLISGLKYFIFLRGYKNVSELTGAALEGIVDTSELDRNSILFPEFVSDKCVGCGRCFISCRDGGHQAISFDSEKRQPKLNGNKCVGCHLCLLVCPEKAIKPAKKRIPKKPHTTA